MNLSHPSSSNRRTFFARGLLSVAGVAFANMASSEITGITSLSRSLHVSSSQGIPSALERDLGDVIRGGSYDWGYHGNAQPLLDALKKLRSHCVNGEIPGIATSFNLLKEDWGVNFPPSTLKLAENYATCSAADFTALEKQLLEEEIQIKKAKEEMQETENILANQPLQYVVSDSVGFILGVESSQPDDLEKLLGRYMEYSFSPKTPNSPNHRIGFAGVVTQIHCILSNRIYSLNSKKGT